MQDTGTDANEGLEGPDKTTGNNSPINKTPTGRATSEGKLGTPELASPNLPAFPAKKRLGASTIVFLTVINLLVLVITCQIFKAQFNNKQTLEAIVALEKKINRLETAVTDLDDLKKNSALIKTEYEKAQIDLKSANDAVSIKETEIEELKTVKEKAKNISLLYEVLLTLAELDPKNPEKSVKKIVDFAAAISGKIDDKNEKAVKFYGKFIKLAETLVKEKDPTDQIKQLKKEVRKLLDGIDLPDNN